ncbi:MAG: hypothetical protein GY861_16765 [bacterium]|nr:hypothetical protein [bacterium]
MANAVTNSMKTMLWKGQIAAASDTFKMILMDVGYNFDKDNHNAYTDVSAYELPTGNGYTQGGVSLTLDAITTDNTEDRCEVTFNTVQWTASGGPLETVGALIFNDSTSTGAGDDYTDAIMAFIDASGTQTVADGAALTVSNIMLTGEDL